MRLPPRATRRAERGITLIEALTYIAIVAMISTVALAAFFKYWEATRRLDRVTDDILRSLNAGELWRADIRRAVRPPVLMRENGEEALELELPAGKVVYLFSGDGVWRRSSATNPWVHLLPQARQSRMFADERGEVVAWRWELELARPKASPGKLVPRFTFVAVPSPSHPVTP